MHAFKGRRPSHVHTRLRFGVVSYVHVSTQAQGLSPGVNVSVRLANSNITPLSVSSLSLSMAKAKSYFLS